MTKTRPYSLSIAAFDPSGGAGVLADIKTFEAHKVNGMGVVAGLTIQNDAEFDGVKWIEPDEIIKQIDVLCRKFCFEYVKIGMIQNLEVLKSIIERCRTHYERCRIVWDPVLKASAGYKIHGKLKQKNLFEICNSVFLITPNIYECRELTNIPDEFKSAEQLNRYCHVLLKGGHNDREKGTDYLFMKNKRAYPLKPKRIVYSTKHGTGCVLSSAITANLAKGHDLNVACRKAKEYVTGFLISNKTLLGYHIK